MLSGRDALVEAAAGVLPDVIELRRRIHRRPEIGVDLPVTQRTVVDALEGLDLEVALGEEVTSVVADLVTDPAAPTILLRADMDALPVTEDTGLGCTSEVPGAMHACGHDAHVAMLVGAARLLVERRDELGGNVRFMFQPGEEGHAGAATMLREGVLTRPPAPRAAFALHVSPNLPARSVGWRPGAVMASTDTFEITVAGKGGHASTPHLAIDPVPVACELVGALQSLVTRRVEAFDPAVLTVGRIEAGTTENVIPETATLVGTIRATSDRTRRTMVEGLHRVAGHVAAAHCCEARVDHTEGYPVTVNDDGFAAFVGEVAGDLVAAFEARSRRMRTPVMGAEDFSYVLREVPGAMVFLGVCPEGVGDPRTAASCHSNRMVLDEAALAVGVALHASVATRWLAAGGTPAAGEPAQTASVQNATERRPTRR